MRKDNSLLVGILLTLLAGALLACMDGIGKRLTLLLPVIQVIWFRYFVQTVLVGAYLSWRTGTGFLRTRHPGLQILRGLCLLATTFLMYEAFKRVPLADATAMLFFSPIMVTLLSVLFLRERIGPHRILAVLVGFGGMLLILGPGFGRFEPALGLALLASVSNALFLLLTRHLAGREDAAATQFNTTVSGAVILSFAVVPSWQTPDAGTGLLLAVLGLFGTLGHFTLVRAFAHAPASLLSPFLYSQVLIAGLLSVVLFGDPLRPSMVAGTALLVASGVYIWWRENRRRLEAMV